MTVKILKMLFITFLSQFIVISCDEDSKGSPLIQVDVEKNDH